MVSHALSMFNPRVMQCSNALSKNDLKLKSLGILENNKNSKMPIACIDERHNNTTLKDWRRDVRSKSLMSMAPDCEHDDDYYEANIWTRIFHQLSQPNLLNTCLPFIFDIVKIFLSLLTFHHLLELFFHI